MEWLIISGSVLVVLALAGLLIWKSKHQPGSVHGDFRFDKHKGLETSKRGLFDRSKFR